MSTCAEVEVLKTKLQAERVRLWQSVEHLSQAELGRPSEEGWSVRDILAHVGFAERANVRFAQLMVTQDEPDQIQAMAQDYPDFVGPFSLDSFNAYMTEKLRGLSLEEVISTLRQVRADTLTWLDTLTAEQLDRQGRHAAWGEQTVRNMLRVLALHDRMHTQDLLKRKT